MPIEWRESFCTGIPGVDHEHRQLVSSLNELMQNVDDDCDREAVIEALDEIYADIASHFALEEEMMRRNHFPESGEHASDHHRLLDEIRELTRGFERSEFVDSEAFEERLSDWFRVHFSTYDARLHREAFMEEHAGRRHGSVIGLVKHARDALFGRSG